jgi:hypothetical protein
MLTSSQREWPVVPQGSSFDRLRPNSMYEPNSSIAAAWHHVSMVLFQAKCLEMICGTGFAFTRSGEQLDCWRRQAFLGCNRRESDHHTDSGGHGSGRFFDRLRSLSDVHWTGGDARRQPALL